MKKYIISSAILATALVQAFAQNSGTVVTGSAQLNTQVRPTTAVGGPVNVQGRPAVAAMQAGSVSVSAMPAMPEITTGDAEVDAKIKALQVEMEAKIKAIRDEYQLKIKTTIGDRQVTLKNGNGNTGTVQVRTMGAEGKNVLIRASGTPVKMERGMAASGTPVRAEFRGEVRGDIMDVTVNMDTKTDIKAEAGVFGFFKRLFER